MNTKAFFPCRGGSELILGTGRVCCGGAHEILGILVPICLCGWVVGGFMGWVVVWWVVCCEWWVGMCCGGVLGGGWVLGAGGVVGGCGVFVVVGWVGVVAGCWEVGGWVLGGVLGVHGWVGVG